MSPHNEFATTYCRRLHVFINVKDLARKLSATFRILVASMRRVGHFPPRKGFVLLSWTARSGLLARRAGMAINSRALRRAIGGVYGAPRVVAIGRIRGTAVRAMVSADYPQPWKKNWLEAHFSASGLSLQSRHQHSPDPDDERPINPIRYAARARRDYGCRSGLDARAHSGR